GRHLARAVIRRLQERSAPSAPDPPYCRVPADNRATSDRAPAPGIAGSTTGACSVGRSSNASPPGSAPACQKIQFHFLLADLLVKLANQRLAVLFGLARPFLEEAPSASCRFHSFTSVGGNFEAIFTTVCSPFSASSPTF